MSKTSAKANPMNKDTGDRNRGSEPGQEQKSERHDRQNMGAGLGTRLEGKNQGRTRRGGSARSARTERADSGRTSKR
jgi:hypothetical protein